MSHPFANLGSILIAALGDPAPISRTRFGGGSYVDGVWVPAASTTITIPAVVQPVQPRALKQLPENERTEEAIAIFTTAELRTSTPAGQEADQISWAGRLWRVAFVETWVAQAGYCRAIATRLGQ